MAKCPQCKGRNKHLVTQFERINTKKEIHQVYTFKNPVCEECVRILVEIVDEQVEAEIAEISGYL